MKTILAIDSTSDILSISLSEDLNILSEIKDDKSIKHMVNIISDIDYVLRKANKNIREIELFGLNLGPGDFTGGRIGISVVKMFSMLSGNSVFGFNSLDVFCVGAMLKNISSISKKISDSNRLHIIPVMDVKNNEMYSGIYEVSRSVNDNKVIFSFNFEDKKYFLNKIFSGFLIKSDDFISKIFQVISKIILWEKCSCPSCGQIFKNNNFHKDNNQEKIQNNRNGLGHKKSSFILTANAVKTYRGLFENLKMEIPLNSKEIEIILDEKNINPSSKYINFLADYSYSYSLKSLPIAPVYVRDFIAFS
ncbi:MAG: tRNA (adenosine(37)-N6)-threonylcarbamoyltransferase complex dimerization subunit type 1 TsaB, partial [Candidatus Humimicrobiaceae bacterium]